MKAMLFNSNKIHKVIKDLEDKIIMGVKIIVNRKLIEKFKYWVIYKKSFYQWGMSPLAFLAYLINIRKL